MLRKFVGFNFKVSQAVDKLWPADMRVEGSRHYRTQVLPAFITPGSNIWDLGSGRYPQISVEDKAAKNLSITGLDLGADELDLAPAGAYDRAIAADLSIFRGEAEADQIVSHCCFEHVHDNTGAFQALASILKPGGRAAIYQPSGNAAFSRLNLMLPEGLKRRLLTLLPFNGGHGGWPAVYDHCTPAGFSELARKAGLEVESVRHYWISGYFMAFTPAHLVWRLWQACYRLFVRNEAAESFTIIVKKPL